MDIDNFTKWLKTEFNFDCFENDFFEKSLYETKKEFENSTINDVPFSVYYADCLHQKFLAKYLVHLKLLLKSIPEPHSSISLTIQGVDLNSYSNCIEELQFSIQKLER